MLEYAVRVAPLFLNLTASAISPSRLSPRFGAEA